LPAHCECWFFAIGLWMPKIIQWQWVLWRWLKKAIFIRENCNHQSEDFFCEYALFFAPGLCLTLHTRTDKILPKTGDIIHLETECVWWPGSIWRPFWKRHDSFSVRNSVFLFVLQCSSPARDFEKWWRNIYQSAKSCRCRFYDGTQIGWRTLDQLGYLRKDLPENLQYEFMAKKMIKKLLIHDDSISLQVTGRQFISVMQWRCGFSARPYCWNDKVCSANTKKNDRHCPADGKRRCCIYSFTPHLWWSNTCAGIVNHIEKPLWWLKRQPVKIYMNGRIVKLLPCQAIYHSSWWR